MTNEFLGGFFVFTGASQYDSAPGEAKGLPAKGFPACNEKSDGRGRPLVKMAVGQGLMGERAWN